MMNKEAIDNVVYGITVVKEIIKMAINRTDDCAEDE